MKKIIVLAGSRLEFERYLDNNGLTDSEAIYGYDAHSMAGIEASKIEIVGTFWDKHDAGELNREAQSRVR